MRAAARFVVLGWDGPALVVVDRLLEVGMEVSVVSEAPLPKALAAVLAVKGAPHDPEALERAGVQDAAALLVCLRREEAEKAVAAARRLNPGIRVVASVQEGDSKAQLLAAGAQTAIDPREEAALEMVRLMTPRNVPAHRS